MKITLSRFERLEVNVFEALFAVLGLLMGGLVPLQQAGRQSSSAIFLMEVGSVVGNVWGVSLIIASLCILVALWRPVTWRWGRALEVFGLITFAGLLAVQAVVLIVTSGSSLMSVVLRLLILPGFLVKVRVILRGEYIALVKPDA